jgi:Domain of unknown function (DUF4331)
MSDHASGPRAFADPVVDVTDMYAFLSPQRPGTLVLVLNVFPFAGPSALFSDAVDYRFRMRPAAIASSGARSVAVSDKEYNFSCRFAVPGKQGGGGLLVQEGTCTSSAGRAVSFRVNDEQGGQSEGLRAFAGVRLDPFFFDGVKALQTIVTRKLAFEAKGSATVYRQNVLSIVIEVDVARTFGTDGPLFAVVGETVTAGSLKVRLERFGRAEIKNFLLLPKDFDTVNRDIELRDLYNNEDAFKVGPAYAGAYRARVNANLTFWDGLDGKTDWPANEQGIHPLTGFLLADFMLVDVSKPFAEDSYLEIERMILKGVPHRSCGGRWLNDDSIDTFLTFLVNGGNGPRISDGVDQATLPASRTFPYLAAPEPNPPPPKAPPIVAR